MRYLVLVVPFLVISLSCSVEEKQPKTGPVVSVSEPEVPTRKAPTVYPRTPAKRLDAEEAYKKRLVDGILTLRSQFRHVTRPFAERLVKEAFEVIAMPGNEWMAPHDLIGLAINESDLRPWCVTGTYVKPDCGITQNHTPLYHKSLKKRRELCKKLTESTKLGFIYAMRELNKINKMCKKIYRKPVRRKNESQRRFDARINYWKHKRYRCLFNTYNQGPRFLWKTCEQRIDKNRYTPKEYKKRLRRCKARGLYWVRSLCFATGVKLNKKPTMSCRRAWSPQWVKRVYGIR